VPTIIRALPYDKITEYWESVPDERWPGVRPHQIWLTVSVGVPETEWEDLNPKPPRFRVLLDTGLSHNFSIRRKNLQELTDLDPSMLDPADRRPVNGQDVPHFHANLWIHRNQPGSRSEFLSVDPFRLRLSQGIAVYDEGSRPENWPPLLGLKALDDNSIQMLIDGERGLVSMRTKLNVRAQH